MSVIRIATRYAKSLIDLAIEQGKLEQVNADMSTLGAAAKNRDLYLFLKSPIIHADKKNAALDAIFKGKLDSFESLGVVSGKLSYISDANVKFDGILRGLEVVFSNRGRRDLQTIDEMNFHFRKINKFYSLEASGLVSGNEKIDGALTVEHYADTDKIDASLKLSGIIFNKKV